MPFTFSHPIFAAPLKLVKPHYLSITGLILGSMSPDFEYFILLEPYQSIGHTWQGLLLQAFPLCLLFAILFHKIVKGIAALHLPEWGGINSKLYHMALNTSWNLRSPAKLLIFFASVTIGFFTHILIDACTHKLGFFVTQLSFLQQLYGGIPVYKWLQYSLSLLGLAAEAIILLALLWNQPSTPSGQSRLTVQAVTTNEKWVYWLLVLAVMLAVTGIKLVLRSSANIIGIMVVAPISGFLLGILLTSILYKFRT